MGSKFQDLDVTLDLTSIPLVDKVNLHRQVGEILYNYNNRNQMTINQARYYVDNLVDNIKVEKVKSHPLFQQKDYYKGLLLKMGLDPVDEVAME